MEPRTGTDESACLTRPAECLQGSVKRRSAQNTDYSERRASDARCNRLNMPKSMDWELRQTLPAKLESVEDFVLDFRAFSKEMFTVRDCFVTELLLREALTNAVIHGCRRDSRRHVNAVVRLNEQRLIVSITDDGKGFNWRDAWKHEATPECCSGRGMTILKNYATRVRFNSKGNVVTFIKRFCN